MAYSPLRLPNLIRALNCATLSVSHSVFPHTTPFLCPSLPFPFQLDTAKTHRTTHCNNDLLQTVVEIRSVSSSNSLSVVISVPSSVNCFPSVPFVPCFPVSLSTLSQLIFMCPSLRPAFLLVFFIFFPSLAAFAQASPPCRALALHCGHHHARSNRTTTTSQQSAFTRFWL